jgi:putative transposase
MRFVEPMQPGCHYHIYNRGINGELIFREPRDYQLFLEKYAIYLPGVTETLAYCLLGNHFHLLVYVPELKENLRMDSYAGLNASRQFSHFFNAYAQSFNRIYRRTGGLFESPFRRTRLAGDSVLKRLIFLIHADAGQAGRLKDFRGWPHSSYTAIVNDTPSVVSQNRVLEYFGGRASFIRFHEKQISAPVQSHGSQWLQPVPDFGK